MRYILAFFCLLNANLFYAQIKVWDHPSNHKTITTEQWQVNDLLFNVKNNGDHPFDTNVSAKVTSESGVQLIPLFYNGGNEWVLRFSAAKTGEYLYEVQSDIKGLINKKGVIKVVANTKTDRHGGVVLSKEDPRHFYYEDGLPYFNLAFECDWLFALDYGEKDLSKTDHLLSLIEKNGFDQVVMNVYSHDVSWKKDSKLATHPELEFGGRQDIYPFLGTNAHPDHSALNPVFFQHLDKVIASMHDKEIVSHLMIYVWNKMVNWPDMDTPEDNTYFDYVVKRYQAFPNLIWDVSKEALGYGRATEGYISERISRIRKLDAYHRLVSVHDYGFCRKHADEIDFASTQNWSHSLYQKMLDARDEFPDKPVFNIEHGGYEEGPYQVFTGAYTDAEVCLRRNYMCLFAGVYSTYYWQDTSWNVIIYNPFEQPEDYYKPRFDYYEHLRTFFDKFPFNKFKPESNHNTNGYNLTDPKDGTVLMYMPKENYLVTLGFLSEYNKTNATMQWFNTLTGEFTEEKPFQQYVASISPWSGKADTILIVKKMK